MVKKIIAVFLSFLSAVTLSACATTTTSITTVPYVQEDDIMIFPIQANGYVGDPMPYFDGETMRVFYLQDARDGNRGFHPWYQFQTNDFVHWTDLEEAIPYVNDYASQDLALGTGSVIQDQNGLYHAFYTGFNGTGNVDYYEMIQHAVSTDLVNWTKIPEDGFYGGQNDFRDPYVLYMENEGLYWMLVTTRSLNKGVLRLYKSSDLSNWTDNGVFFWNDSGTYNMECSTLIQFGDYWYLSYSEQGANRIVHYRYTDDLSKGFTKPEIDYFDGVGFYAGRLEKTTDRLFAFGWVGTKEYDYDGGDFNWAGNLVVHELIQNSDGTLSVKPVEEVTSAINHAVSYVPIQMNIDELSTTQLTFEGKSGYDYYIYEPLHDVSTKMTFTLQLQGAMGVAGLTFFAYDEMMGPLNVVFNLEEDCLEFYNVLPTQFTSTTPQIRVPFDFTFGNSYDVTILIEGQCLSLYLDNQIALTTRMYSMPMSNFGFFSMKSAVAFQNIRFYE